jgi:hypothetical protein
VCYWALLFMPLVILHHLLNVFVQLANKRGFTQKKKKKKKKFIVLESNPAVYWKRSKQLQGERPIPTPKVICKFI